MKHPLVSVKNLSIFFEKSGGDFAVHDISFDIFPGEIVALVGESGSGKTLTSLSILQLLPPSVQVQGQIELFDPEPINLLKLTDKDVRKIRGNKISMIFQEPMTSLNPVKTCGAQVMEAIQTHLNVSDSQAREKVLELFHQVQLPNPEEIFRRYPHQISGGQKQRVMISMAISCHPALLIADEPTTALDVTVQKNILDLIKDFQEKNDMSVLFITHDLELLSEFADRVIVLYKGAIVEQGKVSEVFNQPKHPYTKALLMCRPGRYPRGKRLPVIADFLSENKIAANIPATDLKFPHEENEVHATNPQKAYLEVKGLSVDFPSKRNFLGKTISTFTALTNINLEIKQGQTVGLVGESGSGKSTLGKAILGMLPHTSGSILLNGIPIHSGTTKSAKVFRKEMQIVFQDPYGSLNPRLSIGEAIAEPMSVHNHFSKKERKKRTIALLEKVKLDANAYQRYPHEFSGGQRQRICIARALSLAPDFIIFDESVSALDVSIQAEILNLLNQLKAELKFTSLFISHDLRVIKYISDRIVVMSQGRIVESGPTDEVFYRPQNPYTKMLLSSIPGGYNII